MIPSPINPMCMLERYHAKRFTQSFKAAGEGTHAEPQSRKAAQKRHTPIPVSSCGQKRLFMGHFGRTEGWDRMTRLVPAERTLIDDRGRLCTSIAEDRRRRANTENGGRRASTADHGGWRVNDIEDGGKWLQTANTAGDGGKWWQTCEYCRRRWQMVADVRILQETAENGADTR